MPRVRRPGAGLGMAGLSAAAFSTSGPFGLSLTAAGWSPGAAVTARAGVAAVLLAAPAAVSLRGRWREVRRRARLVTAYGLVAVAGCQVRFFNAIRHLPVGTALLLEYLAPVLVAGWLWARHGQRPGRATMAGSVLAMTGLLLVIGLAGSHQAGPSALRGRWLRRPGSPGISYCRPAVPTACPRLPWPAPGRGSARSRWPSLAWQDHCRCTRCSARCSWTGTT